MGGPSRSKGPVAGGKQERPEGEGRGGEGQEASMRRQETEAAEATGFFTWCLATLEPRR